METLISEAHGLKAILKRDIRYITEASFELRSRSFLLSFTNRDDFFLRFEWRFERIEVE